MKRPDLFITLKFNLEKLLNYKIVVKIKSNLPEPDDDGMIRVVAIFIFRVFSPVVDVHVS